MWSYCDLSRTLVPTGPTACAGQKRVATTNKKIFKTHWKEAEGGKSLNIETIWASAPCRFIFPIPHIPRMLQYDSYVCEEEKENNKIQYFIKQIIYIDMKHWILILKKTNIAFVCFQKLPVSASLARWVSFLHYSPGLSESVCQPSGSWVGFVTLRMSQAKTAKGKLVKKIKITGRLFFFYKSFYRACTLQCWQAVNLCWVAFFFLALKTISVSVNASFVSIL